MPLPEPLLQGCRLVAALCFATWLGSSAVRASDPLPGDSVAPPVNVNIGLFYNEFNTAGEYDPAHGSGIKYNTHLSDDVTVARLIRTFSLGGYTAGVQVFVPYVGFLGQQRIGTTLPSAAPGLLPPIGRARADISSNNGIAQPNFGAFIFPINDQKTGTYMVLGPWIDPPVSGFDKGYALNPSENVWTYEMEAAFHTTLLGTPKTRSLQLEVWVEGYLYSQNRNSADVTPTVLADNLPPIYPVLGVTNPIQTKSVTNATFRQQPTAELRVYLPYQFLPETAAFIAPGFYQSFGGKQTYKINGVGVVDSGTRTNESQLRLVAGTFLTKSLQVMVAGYYDIAARGGPLNRTVLLRLGVFF